MVSHKPTHNYLASQGTVAGITVSDFQPKDERNGKKVVLRMINIRTGVYQRIIVIG
jgi:hypothetical protein